MNDWIDAENHIEKAHEHYDAGRWDEALNELRQAISLNPYQAEWHFNFGLTLEAAGKYAEAAQAFQACFELYLEHQKSDTNSAILIGVNLLRADQHESAITWFDKAIEIDALSMPAYTSKVDAYIRLGLINQAEEEFYIAQQVNPNHAELYSVMADGLMVAGQIDRAVWCLKEAARLDPELPRIQSRLARAYQESGRYERARQLYLRDLRQDPGDVNTLLDFGDLLIAMHRYAEAKEKFNRVLELESSQPEAHFMLGEIASLENNVASALVYFDVVIRLDKEFPAVRRKLAMMLHLRHRDEDLPRIRDLLTTECKSVLNAQSNKDALSGQDEYCELGKILLQVGMVKQSIQIYRAMLNEYPTSHRAHHGLSVSLLESGHIEEGMSSAKRALEFQPRFVPAMHNLALAHLSEQQWIRAGYWVRQALRVEPDDPTLRRLKMKLRFHTMYTLYSWSLKKLNAIKAIIGRPVRA